MSFPEATTLCDKCNQIFEHAAQLLLSNPLELASNHQWAPRIISVVDADYQARLQENMIDPESPISCHLCALIGASILDYLADLPPVNPGQLLVLVSSQRATRVQTFVSQPEADTVFVSLAQCDAQTMMVNRSESARPIQIKVLQDVPVADQQIRPLASPTTWSPESLNQLQSWLRDCLGSHKTCQESRKESKLPRRLIDTMPMGGNAYRPQTGDLAPDDFHRLSLEEVPNVRIVSSSTLPSGTPYMTLSHRWGSPPAILLEDKTSFLLHEDITPHLLRCDDTAVFRHAIHVTRCLGLRYIWIDALCIMQDNGPEKAEDIMDMHEIYVNTTLNISAVEGQVSKGLIFDRNLHSTNPCKKSVAVTVSDGLEQPLELLAYNYRCALDSFEGPLSKRGWVFQERALSPRIAHFTRDQIFWECLTQEASEVLPRGLGKQRRLGRWDIGAGMSTSWSPNRLRQQWKAVVSFYSRTSLSFVDDRLLAVSALAKRFCLVMGRKPDEYLAGIWKNDLPQSLLWFQQNRAGISESQGGAGSTVPHVPSWSWASLTVPISAVGYFDSKSTKAKVLDIDITRLSPNFFGGVEACRLRISGRLCRFGFFERDGSAWVRIAGSDIELEQDETQSKEGGINIKWDTARPAVAEALKSDVDGSASSPTEPEYFLLHIGTDESNGGGGPARMDRGIILRRTDQRGTYTRVGYYVIPLFGRTTRIGKFIIPTRVKFSTSPVEQALSNGALAALSTEDYIERQSNGQCKIDII
ncbi:heterokaryon incompatibility protein-domain-containing protein [Cladorrhinum sp. PSN259]|nr:heterokaryon incompatibility protein-domain-containing protein [Cladorrhinum sp. PSN259]